MYVTQNQSLVGKDLRGHDLRNYDFSGHVMFGADLRGANLRGAKVSLDCATFDGVQLDDNQVAMLLMMFSQAQVNQRWVDGLRELVGSIAGADRLRAIERLIRVI